MPNVAIKVQDVTKIFGTRTVLDPGHPLADAEGMAAFVDTSLRIYAALRGGCTDGGEGAA